MFYVKHYFNYLFFTRDEEVLIILSINFIISDAAERGQRCTERVHRSPMHCALLHQYILRPWYKKECTEGVQVTSRLHSVDGAPNRKICHVEGSTHLRRPTCICTAARSLGLPF